MAHFTSLPDRYREFFKNLVVAARRGLAVRALHGVAAARVQRVITLSAGTLNALKTGRDRRLVNFGDCRATFVNGNGTTARQN